MISRINNIGKTGLETSALLPKVEFLLPEFKSENKTKSVNQAFLMLTKNSKHLI
jgi:hypothetical protein